MYKVNVNGTQYQYQETYNKLFNYIKNYVSELITKFKEKSPDIIKKYEEDVVKTDADVEKYKKELDEKIESYDAEEINDNIDSKLSEFEKYEYLEVSLKKTIDYWYSKTK